MRRKGNTNRFNGDKRAEHSPKEVKSKTVQLAEGIIDGNVDGIKSVYGRGAVRGIRYIFKELIPKVVFYFLTHPL